MALTYTWEIHSIEKQTNEEYTDAIIAVNYTKIGTNVDGIQGHFPNRVELSVDNDGFIDYSNVTLENVISWIQINHDDGYANIEIDKGIAANIAAAEIETVMGAELPWVTGE